MSQTNKRLDFFAAIENITAKGLEEKTEPVVQVPQIAEPEIAPEVEIKEEPKKESIKKDKKTVGQGSAKKTESHKEPAPSPLFVKESKKKKQIKSFNLTQENIEYIEEQSKLTGISLTDIINIIIDTFRENQQ